MFIWDDFQMAEIFFLHLCCWSTPLLSTFLQTPCVLGFNRGFRPDYVIAYSNWWYLLCILGCCLPKVRSSWAFGTFLWSLRAVPSTSTPFLQMQLASTGLSALCLGIFWFRPSSSAPLHRWAAWHCLCWSIDYEYCNTPNSSWFWAPSSLSRRKPASSYPA